MLHIWASPPPTPTAMQFDMPYKIQSTELLLSLFFHLLCVLSSNKNSLSFLCCNVCVYPFSASCSCCCTACSAFECCAWFIIDMMFLRAGWTRPPRLQLRQKVRTLLGFKKVIKGNYYAHDKLVSQSEVASTKHGYRMLHIQSSFQVAERDC